MQTVPDNPRRYPPEQREQYFYDEGLVVTARGRFVDEVLCTRCKSVMEMEAVDGDYFCDECHCVVPRSAVEDLIR